MIHFLQLGTTRTNHIESAGIAVVVDKIGRDFHIIVINQSTRAKDKTIETILGIELLDGVKQASDDIMTARSLSARKNNAHVHLGRVSLITFHELNERHSVSVGEKLLDILLVVNTLCRSTLLHFYSSLKSLRQFWLVSRTSPLQCTFFHTKFVDII